MKKIRFNFPKKGDIKNQYLDKASDEIWGTWTNEQRYHFLEDHNGEILKTEKRLFNMGMKKTHNIQTTGTKKYLNFSYSDLPNQIRIPLQEHISKGQYAKGGPIPHKTWGNPHLDVIFGCCGAKTMQDGGEIAQELAFYQPIIKALQKKGYDAEAKYFDKYQGTYIRVQGHDNFWTKETYFTGERKEAIKKYRNAVLMGAEGSEYSANRSDYWNASKDFVFKGQALILTTADGETKTIENPKVSDLPDSSEIETTFTYKEGTEIQHHVLYPEQHPDIDIEITEHNAKWDISQLLQYLKQAKTMANGGAIKNQYEGKTAEQVWDNWTKKQRYHFLLDHTKLADTADYDNLSKLLFHELAPIDRLIVKNKLQDHISLGEYASGGKIIKPISSKTLNAMDKVGIKIGAYDLVHDIDGYLIDYEDDLFAQGIKEIKNNIKGFIVDTSEVVIGEKEFDDVWDVETAYPINLLNKYKIDKPHQMTPYFKPFKYFAFLPVDYNRYGMDDIVIALMTNKNYVKYVEGNY